MERVENAHDLKGNPVFILTVTLDGARQEPIPFARKEDRDRHLCDLISRHLAKIDDKFRDSIILHLEARDFHRVIKQYRSAQLHNSRKLPLDFYESGAMVIM